MIESTYLCIWPGNGPNELIMGTLVKRKCVGREAAATESAVYVWRWPQDIELHLFSINTFHLLNSFR